MVNNAGLRPEFFPECKMSSSVRLIPGLLLALGTVTVDGGELPFIFLAVTVMICSLLVSRMRARLWLVGSTLDLFSWSLSAVSAQVTS